MRSKVSGRHKLRETVNSWDEWLLGPEIGRRALRKRFGWQWENEAIRLRSRLAVLAVLVAALVVAKLSGSDLAAGIVVLAGLPAALGLMFTDQRGAARAAANVLVDRHKQRRSRPL